MLGGGIIACVSWGWVRVFSVEGLEIKVFGLGFRVKGLGFRV